MKTKISAKVIDALTLPEGKTEEVYWDTDPPGFGLRLRRREGADGEMTRTWIVQYKREGETRRITIGKANVLGVEAARKVARKVQAKVQLGEDPAAERQRPRHTLRSLLDEYLADKEKRVRPRTFTEIKRYLTGESYFKALHKTRIDKIHRADVAAEVVRIERECGGPTAIEARGALSTFFVWAMSKGLCENNPTINVFRPAANKPRERVLDDSELVAIWRACVDEAVESEHPSDCEYRKIIRLLILTGCRRQEIGDMRWSEFSPDGTKWTIPASRSKNKRPHVLPVMPMMRQIIDIVPRMATRDALFGLRAAGFTNWVLPKTDLDRRSGVTGWHLHDIRRTVATQMGHLGVLPHVVEAALNHQSGSKRGVAGVYNKSPYEREVRNALATWHDHLRSLIEGRERKVVPLRAE